MQRARTLSNLFDKLSDMQKKKKIKKKQESSFTTAESVTKNYGGR